MQPVSYDRPSSRGVFLGAISAVFISIILIGNNMRLRYNYNIRNPVRTILEKKATHFDK